MTAREKIIRDVTEDILLAMPKLPIHPTALWAINAYLYDNFFKPRITQYLPPVLKAVKKSRQSKPNQK